MAYARLVLLHWQYGTLRAGSLTQTIAWYLLAFIAYIMLMIRNERRPLDKRWVWGGAILWRVMLLLTVPTLSDDVYRYMWDGHVSNAGVSPYAYTIEAPELDYLDIAQRAMANNTWMASPYLPAAQALFYAVAALFPLQPFYFQVTMLLVDLGAAYMLSTLLGHVRLPGRRLFLYLWNPLVIVEVAHGAHVDALMLLLTMGAILATSIGLGERQEDRSLTAVSRNHLSAIVTLSLSPLLLSLATLTKPLPVLLLPVFVWLWNWRQRLLYGLLIVLILLPFGLQAGWGIVGELDGLGLLGALRIYASQWKFNSGLFYWFELWLQGRAASYPEAVARVVVAALMLVLLTVVWLLARKHRRPRTALRLMSLPIMGYILLSPTLHPWYLLILLAFLPFLTPGEKEPKGMWLLVSPWLYLSAALIFSYLAYLDPNGFGELAWVRVLEWLPMLALLAAASLSYLARRQHLSAQR